MAKVDLASIGQRIQTQRLALGYTQQYIYEKLDISQNHYSRIENGRAGMSFEILLQLSDLLGLSTDYILTGRPDSADKLSFLDSYKKLNKKQRNYIDEHIKLFIKSNLK